eukprot:UN28238
MKKGIKKYTTSLEALSNLAMTHMANPDDSDLEDPVIKTEGRHSLKRRVTRSVSRANTEQRKRSRKRRKRNTFTDLIDDELIGMINGDTDPKNGSHCLHKIEDEKYDEEQGRMLWKVRWSNQKKVYGNHWKMSNISLYSKIESNNIAVSWFWSKGIGNSLTSEFYLSREIEVIMQINR